MQFKSSLIRFNLPLTSLYARTTEILPKYDETAQNHEQSLIGDETLRYCSAIHVLAAIAIRRDLNCNDKANFP